MSAATKRYQILPSSIDGEYMICAYWDDGSGAPRTIGRIADYMAHSTAQALANLLRETGSGRSRKRHRERPPVEIDRAKIEAAIVRLKTARDLLAEAGCPQATAYVRRALKSTHGALNHTVNLLVRQRIAERRHRKAETP